MPTLEMKSKIVDNDDLEIEIDSDEETIDAEDNTTKRVRKTFADENVYVFDNKEEAAKAKPTLRYTDKTDASDGFRVWTISDKPRPKDDDDEEGKEIAFVLAKNSAQAAEFYLLSKDRHTFLTSPMKRGGGGGRRATKIESTTLQYGKMVCFQFVNKSDISTFGSTNEVIGIPEKDGWKPNTPASVKADFESWFSVGGKAAHYRDDNGIWKEATD